QRRVSSSAWRCPAWFAWARRRGRRRHIGAACRIVAWLPPRKERESRSKVFGHLWWIDPRGVIMRKVSQNAAAIGRLPPKQFIGKGSKFVRPHQFLRHEIIHAGLFVDLRKLPVVAKRVRVPSDLHVDSEFIMKIVF